MAQYADWIFVLARTNPQAKKQEGISFFLVDMKSPGITVKPIQTIDGGHEVNEVFLDDVRVPADALVGEENKGWDYAKFLLANERNGIARVGVSKARLDRVRELASIAVYGTGPKIEDPFFRAKLAEVEVELKALEVTQMRVISNRRNAGKPDPASSVLKIKGSEIQQATTDLLMEVVGPYALPYQEPGRHEQRASGRPGLGGDRSRPTYFNTRKVSIYGGSNEIQREHHRQGDSGALRQMDFELSPEQEQLRDNVARLMRERYGFEARKGYQASSAGMERGAMARLRRDGPARRALRRSRRRLWRRRGRDDDRDGAIRQGAGARALPADGRPLRRASEARRQREAARRAYRRHRRGRFAAELRAYGEAIGVRSQRCRL